MLGQAFLNGQTGQALFKTKEGAFALNLRKQTTKPCVRQDVDFFFDSETEIDTLENVTVEQVFEQLKTQKHNFDALNSTIAGFDPVLSISTRKMAIQQAESLLGDTNTYNFVQNRLFGNHVPKEADLTQALGISQSNGCNKTSYFYECLAQKGEVIGGLQFFFSQKVLNYELSQTLPRIKDTFESEGVFTSFFKAAIKADEKALNKIVLDLSFNASLKKYIPQLSKFLTDFKNDVQNNFFENDYIHVAHEENEIDFDQNDYNINELLTNFISLDKYKKKDQKITKKTKKRTFTEDFQGKLANNIEIIIAFAQENDIYNVQKRAYQLLEHNCRNSRQADVIKTLTNLSQRFFDINQLDLAEEFVGYIDILGNYDDAFPFTLRTNILLKRGYYEEAENIINQTIKDFPNDIVPRTIKAEILKAKGQYEDAEKLIDQIIKDFPKEIVPRNIKAEILKAKGQYELAEELKDQTIQNFPNEIVPRTIKVEILKVTGQYEEAEKLIDQIIKDFPNDIVSRTIKAEILKAQGQYEEAEKLIDQIIKDFPKEIVPRTIKTEILKAIGQYEDAEKLINQIIKDFPKEIVPRNIKAEILKVQGQYEKALSCYDETIKLFPNYSYTKIGRLSVLLLLGKLQIADFRKWDEKPILKNSDDRVEYHILGMFNLKKGNFQKALAIFENGYSQSKNIEDIQYYLTAISVTKIRLKLSYDIKALYEANEINKTIANKPFNKMLIAHAAIENKKIVEAQNILNAMTPQVPHLIILRNDLLTYSNNKTGLSGVVRNRIYDEEMFLLMAV